MTTDEQALKLLAIATDLNTRLEEPDLLFGTYGVNSKLSFHLDGKVFTALVKLSKMTPTAYYQSGSLHSQIVIGNVQFDYCHNLL